MSSIPGDLITGSDSDYLVIQKIGDYIMQNTSLSYQDGGEDEEALSLFPEEFQNMFFLSSFISDAGGNGLVVHVSQSPGYLIKGAHRALSAIAFSKLIGLYEQAIALSAMPNEDGVMWAEYPHEVEDISWFKSFKTDIDLDSAEEVLDTQDTFKMINDEISSVASDYINSKVRPMFA
jgi:hypothetical protein